MCGVPVHAADDYLQRLIAHRPPRRGLRADRGPRRGEEARAQGGGAPRRGASRHARHAHRGDAARCPLAQFPHRLVPRAGKEDGEHGYALASLDISTGELIASSVGAGDLAGELARLKPGEVLVGDDLAGDAALRRLVEEAGAALTPCPRAHFDSVSGERALERRVSASPRSMLSASSPSAELAALAGLLTYVEITQVGKAPLLRPPRKESAGSLLIIDAATRANLELVRSNQGARAGSLLAAIDRTVTAAGARELASRLASPLTDPATLNARLDAVSYLADEAALAPRLARSAQGRRPTWRARWRGWHLGAAVRAISARSATRSAAAHDLAAQLLRTGEALGLPRELDGHRRPSRSRSAPDRTVSVAAALADDASGQCARRRLHPDGADADLDEHRRLRDGSRQVIAGLQATYAEATGIKSLKVRHNNVLGYFVEVTALHGPVLTKPPHVELFIHRQTLANVVRFSTPELAELEARITQAADRALAVELEIFARPRRRRAGRGAGALSAASAALAELDHYAGLAELAVEQNYVRPKIDASLVFAVEEGRHPMVEQTLRRSATGRAFVGNDCRLGDER